MTGDIPSISTSTYAATTVGLANLQAGFTTLDHQPTAARGMGQWIDTPTERIERRRFEQAIADCATLIPAKELPTMATTPIRRLVQVVIADTDENVPLAQALIYKGEPQFTDATDQELFFEIEINSLLKTHNAARTKIVNKKIKDRTEYLEPAKIRDLKMVVVNIASF